MINSNAFFPSNHTMSPPPDPYTGPGDGTWDIDTDIELGDAYQVIFGDGSDASIAWNTAQTQDALVVGLSGSNVISIMEKGDIAVDFGFAAQTDPTLVMHSADHTVTSAWLSMAHDQTDGVLTAGLGSVKLTNSVSASGTPSTSVTLSAAAHTAVDDIFTDVDIDLSRTVAFAAGDIDAGSYYGVLIQAPTFTIAAANRISNAATFRVDTIPVGSTNVQSAAWSVASFGGSAAAGAGQSNTEYRVIDLPSHTVTYTGSTQVTSDYGVAAVEIGQITVANSSGPTWDTVAGLVVATPTSVQSNDFTELYGARIGAAATQGTAVAGALYSAIDVPAHALTYDGTTQITSRGPAGISIGAITVTGAAGLTVDTASSLYISGPPTADTCTVTAAYSVWVDSGYIRYDQTAAEDGSSGACTLGQYGGNGPTAAAQALWMKINLGGTVHWIPAWT